MHLSHDKRAPCKVRILVFVFRPLPTEESNRRFSIQPPSERSIGPALIAWQSGVLQSQGARFCIQVLLTEESNRRTSVQTPSDCSIGHALIA